MPIYCQYNSYAPLGSHNYTVDRSENNSLSLTGWTAEGLAWFGAEPGFVKVPNCVVGLSIFCNGMTFNPISLGRGDARVLLPSFATSDSTVFVIDSDVYVGQSHKLVSVGESVDLRICIGDELVDNAEFCFYNELGEVYERISVEKSSKVSSIFISSSDPSGHGREWARQVLIMRIGRVALLPYFEKTVAKSMTANCPRFADAAIAPGILRARRRTKSNLQRSVTFIKQVIRTATPKHGPSLQIIMTRPPLETRRPIRLPSVLASKMRSTLTMWTCITAVATEGPTFFARRFRLGKAE